MQWIPIQFWINFELIWNEFCQVIPLSMVGEWILNWFWMNLKSIRNSLKQKAGTVLNFCCFYFHVVSDRIYKLLFRKGGLNLPFIVIWFYDRRIWFRAKILKYRPCTHCRDGECQPRFWRTWISMTLAANQRCISRRIIQTRRKSLSILKYRMGRKLDMTSTMNDYQHLLTKGFVKAQNYYYYSKDIWNKLVG